MRSLNSLARTSWPVAAKSLVAAVALLGSLAAHAVPITYTFTGLVSGSFTPTGGTLSSFTGRALTVTISTDTTNINTVRFGTGIPATQNLVPGSISVASLGSGSFVNPLYVFNNQGSQIVGFGNVSNNDLIDIQNTTVGLGTYGLVTNFGPIGGSVFSFSQFNAVALSFGTLTLTGFTNPSFQATVVPEPETWALMAAGLAWVAVRARRRVAA